MALILDQIKQFTVHSVGSWGYLAIFVLMTAESACIPVPSELTMPVAGLLAAEGKMNFFLAGLLGAAANLVGSWLAYAAGRFGGRRLVLRYGRYILVKPHDVERADLWFGRYGASAVFFSRLLPVLRTFISLPAGITRMPLGRFSALTLAGCLPWSFALTYAGYELGRHWQSILRYTEPFTFATAALLFLAVGMWYFRRLRRRSAQG